MPRAGRGCRRCPARARRGQRSLDESFRYFLKYAPKVERRRRGLFLASIQAAIPLPRHNHQETGLDRRKFIPGITAVSAAASVSAKSVLTGNGAAHAARHANEPLWTWTAVELARGIRVGQISSRQATESCLQRMREVNPVVNAVVESLETEALSAADAADRRTKSRRNRDLPPLHGVPVTTKINVDLAGHPTTNGIVALRNAIASEDSAPVANLRKAGAVVIGRTNTPAFSFRWFTENDLHGRTLNPWLPSRTPGGSSGGAASAVAVGIGPIAHGNDIAGSVRYPAYCCGVAAIRPSLGRVASFNPSSAQGLRGIASQRRLDTAVRKLEADRIRPIADFALETGFSNQAHLASALRAARPTCRVPTAATCLAPGSGRRPAW